MDVDFNILKVCRTCESPNRFLLVDSVQDLHQLLKTYLNLYPLPKQEVICQTCLDFIFSFKDFDVKCQRTDAKLRQKLLSAVKVEKIEEVELPVSGNACSISRCDSESNHSFQDDLMEPEEECKPIVALNITEDEDPLFSASSKRSTKYIKAVCLERISVPKDIQQEYQSSKQKFICEICEEKFTRKPMLKEHMKLRHILVNNTETVCTKAIEDREDDQSLTNIQLEISRKPTKKFCDNLKTQKTDAPKHPRQMYTCDICKFEYTSKNVLQVHLERLHRTTFKCQNCPEEYDREYDLWLHVGKIHDKSAHFIHCFYCRKPQIKEQLIDHLVRSHQADRDDLQGIDVICDSEVPSTSVSTSLEEPSCFTCNLSFTKREHLTIHLIKMHGVKANPRTKVKDFEDKVKKLMANSKIQTGYKCQTCGRIFTNHPTKKNACWVPFRRHVIRKHMEKTHECSICKKKFSFHIYLTEHIAAEHSNANVLTCDICKKTFKQRKRIRAHMDMHIQHPWLFCDICGKGFKKRSNLYQHILHHDKLRPKKVRQCTYCGKSFTSDDGFKRHVARHEGTFVKLRCEICRKVFFSERSRNKHMETVHS